MARSLFGKAASDWAVTIDATNGAIKAADRTGTAWDAATGGNQHTDLEDLTGTPSGSVRARRGQYAFWGPDGVRMLWMDFGGGERELVVALPDIVTEILDRATAAERAAATATDAADRAEAVGDTNDTITEGLLKARASKTTAALMVNEPALVASPDRYDGIDLTGNTASDGLQTLLDSLSNNSYKKAVKLLPGVYYRPGGFTINRPNVLLEGDGPAAFGISGSAVGKSTTELRASDAGAAVLTIGSTVTDWRGAHVKNIGLTDGSPGKDQVAQGIKLMQQNNGVLEDIAIYDLIAGAGIESFPSSGNPQYWLIRNPQIRNVLYGILQNGISSDWSVQGGVLHGIAQTGGGCRPGSIGIVDRSGMKTNGVSVQFFETELSILGGASMHTALTIESANSFVAPLPKVGVEFGAEATGNYVQMEHANAAKYITGRAVSMLAGSNNNQAFVQCNVTSGIQRAVDDNAGSTGNFIRERGYGDSQLKLSHQGPLPTASATYAGVMRRVAGGSGVADQVVMCKKAADGTWAWRPVAESTSGASSSGGDWSKPTGVVAQNMPRTTAFNVTVAAPASGQQMQTAIWLEAGQVISSLTFTSGSTAMAGATNLWFGLYDVNRNKLAVTGDDAAAGWAANKRKTLNLAAPYTVPSSGYYYAGVVVVATTMPTLAGVNSGSSEVVSQLPYMCGVADSGLTGPASAPATAAVLTNVPRIPLVQAA